MDEILNMDINEMAGVEFDCSCGEHHNFTVQEIAIDNGAIRELPRMAEPFKDGKILIVSDSNTYRAAGENAAQLLKDAGFNVKELMFDTGDDILIPDEKTLGRILQEQDKDVTLMVAVGAGVINDSVKYVTSRTQIPYIVVATAPSMDGYVSDGAPIISHGFKYSLPAHLCYGVIGDMDILKTAPAELIRAGYGDVVAKITALADWDLAVKEKGEHYCDTCVTLVKRALDKCIASAEGLKTGESASLKDLMDALTMTGVAMGLLGFSRPASGAEHMLSHYWEMAYIAQGRNPVHHGLMVAVASPVIARFFEEVSDILPEGVAEKCPAPDEIKKILAKGGTPGDPKEIGIEKDLFHESLLNGYTVRPRYSVMEFAMEHGRLEEIADKITEEIYG